MSEFFSGWDGGYIGVCAVCANDEELNDVSDVGLCESCYEALIEAGDDGLSFDDEDEDAI